MFALFVEADKKLIKIDKLSEEQCRRGATFVQGKFWFNLALVNGFPKVAFQPVNSEQWKDEGIFAQENWSKLLIARVILRKTSIIYIKQALL